MNIKKRNYNNFQALNRASCTNTFLRRNYLSYNSESLFNIANDDKVNMPVYAYIHDRIYIYTSVQ